MRSRGIPFLSKGSHIFNLRMKMRRKRAATARTRKPPLEPVRKRAIIWANRRNPRNKSPFWKSKKRANVGGMTVARNPARMLGLTNVEKIRQVGSPVISQVRRYSPIPYKATKPPERAREKIIQLIFSFSRDSARGKMERQAMIRKASTREAFLSTDQIRDRREKIAKATRG